MIIKSKKLVTYGLWLLTYKSWLVMHHIMQLWNFYLEFLFKHSNSSFFIERNLNI